MQKKQLVLDISVDRAWANAPSDELGEVFTRRWVVDLILDLVGYTVERDLANCHIIEPACGEGAFLGAIVDRLIASSLAHGHGLEGLAACVTAFDLSELNAERARKRAATRLVDAGMDVVAAEALARGWIHHADFLLEAELEPADFVVGNPPYIRLENVPAERSAAYRDACTTMRGRSDVYVGFIERGLRVLKNTGTLGFIVADRWMHNQYGAGLRKLIGDYYSMQAVLEMHDANPFEDEVSAYPAITIVRRAPQGAAVLAQASSSFGAKAAERFKRWTTGRTKSLEHDSFNAARLASWFDGDELWPSGDPECLAVVADLEGRFPPLEDASTGTRVGIGVASGADRVYLTKDPEIVEDDRLLPLAVSRDTATGDLRWSGRYLINPWRDGELVRLDEYPRLGRYFEHHADQLRERHVAKRRPASWYRTIDRIDPGLQARPKLLLPDIKAAIHPVLDHGTLYPHHNLYFVTSTGWDLEVLGGVLLSQFANLFVGTYCVKMRGGCYRFQAQYLRRIRVPAPHAISRRDRRELAASFSGRDVERATATASRLYGIDRLPRSFG